MIKRIVGAIISSLSLVSCKPDGSLSVDSWLETASFTNMASLNLDRGTRQIQFRAALPEFAEEEFIVNYAPTGIASEVSFTPAKEGRFRVEMTGETSRQEFEVDLAHLAFLDTHWSPLVVRVVKAIEAVRTEYGRDAPITPDSATITFLPPGDYIDYVSDYWTCIIELSPYDGQFSASFNANGEIFDAGVAF